MGTALLFLTGLFLTFLVFPTAYYVSAALGYFLGLIAIGIGAYMFTKKKSKASTALGIVLILVSLITIGVTATIHATAYVTYEVLKNLTQEKSLSGKIGEPMKVDGFTITVLDVKEGKYIANDDSYYSSKPGYKVVVVRLRIENDSNEIKHLYDVFDFVLITDARRSYSNVYPIQLNWILNPNETVKAEAIRVVMPSEALAPHTYTVEDVLFQVPLYEDPVKLMFKTGVLGKYEVSISLK